MPGVFPGDLQLLQAAHLAVSFVVARLLVTYDAGIDVSLTNICAWPSLELVLQHVGDVCISCKEQCHGT